MRAEYIGGPLNGIVNDVLDYATQSMTTTNSRDQRTHHYSLDCITGPHNRRTSVAVYVYDGAVDSGNCNRKAR